MKNMIIKLLNKKTVKNSFWIIGERVFQVVLSFIITTISARLLGTSNYGILNYGVSFVTFFTALSKLGFDSIIVNELIARPKDEGLIIGTSIVFRIVSSLISILLILIITFVLNSKSELIIIVTLLQSLVLLFQATHILDYWFQSKLLSKYVSIAKAVSYLIVSAYKLFLLVCNFGVKWFALSTVFDSLIISIFLIIFYNKKANIKFAFNYKVGIELLKKSYHFIFSGIMVIIYTQIDKLMIGNMLSTSFVGIYSAALTVISAFSFVPEAIIISARPVIYNAKKKNEKEYYHRLKQTFAIVFYLCVLFSVAVMFFSKTIINILYGKQYFDAIKSLNVLIWTLPFSQLGVARGIWIVSEGLNKYTKKYLIWGAIINIILNYMLIKSIGIIGAAIATLITEIFTCLISPIFYKKTKNFTKIVFDSILFKF